MSPTTLALRAEAGRFITAESDRVVALIAVYEATLSLFENDAVASKIRMSSQVRGLGSRRPFDILGTRVETTEVLDLIGRLESGALV